MQKTKYEYYLAGLNFPNPDGRSRSAILKECADGEGLTLKREPQNRYDKNAIAVYRTATMEQLGYVPALPAKRLSRQLDEGDVEIRTAVLQINPTRAGAQILVECVR